MSTTIPIARDALLCGRCNRLLGEQISIFGQQLFLSVASHPHGGEPPGQRVIFGPMPNVIICESCRPHGIGRWQNPRWAGPADLDLLMNHLCQFVQTVPRAPLPARTVAVASR